MAVALTEATHQIVTACTELPSTYTLLVWALSNNDNGSPCLASKGSTDHRPIVEFGEDRGVAFVQERSGDDFPIWDDDAETPPSGSWQCIVVRYDTTNLDLVRIDVDGTPVDLSGPDPEGTVVSDAEPWMLGCRGDGIRVWNGYLSEFALWDALLSDTDLDDLAAGASPLAVNDTDLRCYHRLLSTTDLEDLSGNQGDIATMTVAGNAPSHPDVDDPPAGGDATAQPAAIAATAGVPAPSLSTSSTVAPQAVRAVAGVPAPTLVFTTPIAAGSDDADQGTNDSMALAGTNLYVDANDGSDPNDWIGLRFLVGLPQGIPIASAFVDVVISDSAKNDAEGTWTGHDTDNAGTFTTATDNIGGRTATSASVSWTTNDLGSSGAQVSTPDLKAIVQEIIDRAGWASGNGLALLYNQPGATDDLQIAALEHATLAPPQLRIAVVCPTVARPAAIAATAGVPSPQLSTSSTITPTAIAATAGVPAPTVSAAVSAAPAAVAAPASIPAPSLSTGSTATPAAVAAPASVPAPNLSTGTTVEATAIAATAGVPVPTVDVGSNATATPSAIAVPAGVPAPSLSAGASASPAAIGVTAGVPAPSVATGSTVQPTAIAAIAGVPAPSVSTGASATVTPSAIGATTGVPSPQIATSATVTPVAVAATAGIPDPTEQAGATPAPGVIAAIAGVPAPSIITGSSASPPAIPLTVTVPAPVVSAGSRVDVAAIPATVSIPAPIVSSGATLLVAAVAATVGVPTVTPIVTPDLIGQPLVFSDHRRTIEHTDHGAIVVTDPPPGIEGRT